MICKDPSGIASLICSLGTQNFTTTNVNDTIWSANVTGLEKDRFNKISLIATDKSLRANKSYFNVFVNYDPTIEDNVAPTIMRVNSLPVNLVIKDSIITIIDSLYDESGIDSIFWTMNGKNKRMMSPVSVTFTGGKYSLTDTLRRYQIDTIDVYVQDKSTNHNHETQRIIINYNVPPVCQDTSVSTTINTPITISLNADSPDGDVIKWSRLVDPSHGTLNLTGANSTYTPATDWSGTDSFKVSASDQFWNDTLKVVVVTTDNRIAPKNVTIVVMSSSDTVIQGNSLSMSVTMNPDVTPAPTYRWFKNNSSISTASTYNLPAAILVDAGNYKVVVSNAAGSDSDEVTITVLPVYTLTTNRSATGGTVTVVKDTSGYISGASVRLTATPATGYRFVNWTGDTTLTTNPLTVTMNKNRVLTANYKRQFALTLTSSDAGKGMVASTAGNNSFVVDSGAAIPIAATPSPGYVFKQWNSTAAGVVINSTSSASTTVTLTQANATVQGVFGCVTFKKQLSFGQYSDVTLKDAVQTSDGGYLVVGGVGPNANILLVKLNSLGDSVWTKVDNTLSSPNVIRKVSSGYLVSGKSSNMNLATGFCFAQNGNLLWSLAFGSSAGPFSTIANGTKDDEYIFGASQGVDFSFTKASSVRTIIIDTIYPSTLIVADCIQSRDRGHIFVGPCCQNYDNQAIKIDNTGAISWSISFSSALPSYISTKILSVDTTIDGGCIIAGSGNLNGQYSGFILKISSIGLTGAEGAVNIPNLSSFARVRCLKNGDFFIAGGTLSAGNAGGSDIYIARLSSGGALLQEATYGSTSDESANSLQLTSDGGTVLVGSQNWVIKTDENGDVD